MPRLTTQLWLTIHSRLTAPSMVLVPVALALTGCARDPLVGVELLNRTGGACDSAYLELNGDQHLFNANVPNGNFSIGGGFPYPMPATATLRWKTEDKIEHSATIDVPAQPRESARFLDYVFVILPKGRAKAAVLAWNETGSQAETERKVSLRDDLGRDGGPNYRVGVKNTTGVNVSDVDVRFGPYAVNAGIHLSGSGQDYTIAWGLPYPVTKSASVRWVTADGREWTRDVDLSDLLPSALDDKCFWFVLTREGDVTVRVVNWNDLRAGKHPDLCRGS